MYYGIVNNNFLLSECPHGILRIHCHLDHSEKMTTTIKACKCGHHKKAHIHLNPAGMTESCCLACKCDGYEEVSNGIDEASEGRDSPSR